MRSKMSEGCWTSRNSRCESRCSRPALSFTTFAWRFRAGGYAWHSGPVRALGENLVRNYPWPDVL